MMTETFELTNDAGDAGQPGEVETDFDEPGNCPARAYSIK